MFTILMSDDEETLLTAKVGSVPIHFIIKNDGSLLLCSNPFGGATIDVVKMALAMMAIGEGITFTLDIAQAQVSELYRSDPSKYFWVWERNGASEPWLDEEAVIYNTTVASATTALLFVRINVGWCYVFGFDELGMYFGTYDFSSLNVEPMAIRVSGADILNALTTEIVRTV